MHVEVADCQNVIEKAVIPRELVVSGVIRASLKRSLPAVQLRGNTMAAESVLRELGVNNGGSIVFDRSRVRILVCDPSSSTDVVDLLRRCSYQVIAVPNPRQAMELIRTGKAKVDLILAEVDLPNKRGFKILKCFTKEEQLRQIPIVMMSSRDEIALVGKCLRLGAADYLVKPLRTNELLNLWTHMWRRRRMLGMTEKHLISGNLNDNDAPVDILFADTSESNTNSIDVFSEDSNDQARRSVMDNANSRLAISNDLAHRTTRDDVGLKHTKSISQLTNSPPLESCPAPEASPELDTPPIEERPLKRDSPPVLELTLKISSDPEDKVHEMSAEKSLPKRTELKIGESSAFLRYKFSGRQSEKQASVLEKHGDALSDGDLDREHHPPLLHTRSVEVERFADWHKRHGGRSGEDDEEHFRQKQQQQQQQYSSSPAKPKAQCRREGSTSSEWQPRLFSQISDARDQSLLPDNRQGVARDASADRNSEIVQQSRNSAGCASRGGSSGVVMAARDPGLAIATATAVTGWSDPLRPRYAHNPPIEQFSIFQMSIQNEGLMGVPTIPPFVPPHLATSMLPPNMHTPGLLTPPMQVYCGLEGPPGLTARLPPMHTLPPGHGLLPPAGFSYYPVSLPVGPPQIWSPVPAIPISERKLEKAERREAALSKFRQKRKDRCFEKKIRYVSRKRLAEQRPRNRGQFVRRSNGGSEICEVGGDDSDEDEEDDENASSGIPNDQYPVGRAAVCVTLG